MRPDVTARLLGEVEDKWVNSSLAVLTGSEQEETAVTSMVSACSKVVKSVIAGSSGDTTKVSEYMADVCARSSQVGHSEELCKAFSAGLSNLLTGDQAFNREDLNPGSFCQEFYKGAVANAAKAEEQRLEQEAKERAEAKEREEEERLEAEKLAEEEKARKEAAEEEARKQREAEAEKAAAEAAKAEAAKAATSTAAPAVQEVANSSAASNATAEALAVADSIDATADNSSTAVAAADTAGQAVVVENVTVSVKDVTNSSAALTLVNTSQDISAEASGASKENASSSAAGNATEELPDGIVHKVIGKTIKSQ